MSFSHFSNLLFSSYSSRKLNGITTKPIPERLRAPFFPLKFLKKKNMGSKTWRDLNQNCDLQIFIFVSFRGECGFGFLWIFLDLWPLCWVFST